jgi:enoyl-CoA hydratase/carnithine racemase
MQATTNPPQAPRPPEPWGKDVKGEFEGGIAWVTLNRPEKRNAMSPALNREMIEVLDALTLTIAARCWF